LNRLKYQLSIAVMITLGSLTSLIGQDEKEKEDPKTLVEFSKTISELQATALKEYRSAATPDTKNAALVKYYGAADGLVDDILKIVQENPQDRMAGRLLQQLNMSRNPSVVAKTQSTMLEVAKADLKGDASFDMLMMLISGNSKPMVKSEAQDLLLENFGDSEKMAGFAMTMTRAPASDSNQSMLRNLMEKSSHDSVRGAATYALGKMLASSEKTKEEGFKLIKSIPEKFPNVTVGRNNLAKMVEGEIFEMENLQIGMDVPDIVGEDVDGVEFKLSDYKGKVVVIDFWGDW
jgi:hypothetical protein